MTIRVLALAGLMVAASPLARISAQAVTQDAPTRPPDVIFAPTPEDVVAAMLRVANVGEDDVVYDLGCGDGRIPVAAASTYRARAVCIDIDPRRIEQANDNVARNKVGDRVRVLHADLFATDISEATVVTLYLLQALNIKLIPTLQKLRPGTRIVSHAFPMGNCTPEQELDVNGRKVYYWTVPMTCQD